MLGYVCIWNGEDMDTFTIRNGGVSGGFKQMLHNITDLYFSKLAGC